MQENFNEKVNKEEVGNFSEENNTFYTYFPFMKDPKILQEKAEIKKVANATGLSLLIIMGIIFILGIILSFFSVISLNGQSLAKVFSEPAVEQVIQIGMSLFCFTIPAVVVFKAFRYRISDLVSFKKTEKGLGIPLYFFGVAFCAFANIASSYMNRILSNFGIDVSLSERVLPRGIFGFMLTFISMAIVPALVEEFTCRGIIMGALKKYGEGFAIITSSVVFGLMHGNFEQMPFAFLVGMVLGFVTIKTGSLRIAIAVHFTNNFISVIFNYFLKNASLNVQNVIYTVFLLVCLILGMVFLSAGKITPDIFKLNNKTVSKEKEKYKWFFLSPTVIIFIVFNVIESLAILFS